MHVMAQLKVTNMNLSVTTDYKVFVPHINLGLIHRRRIKAAVNNSCVRLVLILTHIEEYSPTEMTGRV